jgi:hypothetical protein
MLHSSGSDAAAFLKKWDRSGKGLLDLKRVINAATVEFELLDKEHKGQTQQERSWRAC